MPRISDRARLFPDSPIRKLAPLADAARARGLRIHGLNIGQPDVATPPEFLEALRGYDAPVLAYGRSEGEPALREAFAGYYRRAGIAVAPSDIVVTVGGSEALLFALQIAAGPGDEILCFEPFYTNYLAFARMSGVGLKALSVAAADGFHLPAEDVIRAAVTPRTKAILVCSPNNPTGTVLRRDELEAVGRIAEELGLFVIGDEVYREFVYEGEHTSVLSIPALERRAILVDSVSKRYSACGARIGCLVSRDRDVVAAAIRMAQGRLCPPVAEQRGALAAANLGPDFFTPVREEYRRRRDAAFEGLAAIPGTTCLKPAGAFYLMAELPVGDAEAFTRWLLTDFEKDGETVMLAAGPGFYATEGRGARQVRLAYVLEVPRIQRAMACLAEAVEAYASVRAV